MRLIFLQNFIDVLRGKKVYAKYFKIGIHSRYKKEELADNLKLQKEAVDEIKSRLNHLAEKTEILFNSNKSILFVAKVLHKDFEDDCNYIKNLYKDRKSVV